MSKFKRRWSTEECIDVVRRHVDGESARSIAASYDRSPSTVTRLLRSDDIAPIVSEAKASIDAAAQAREREAADALRREEQRKRDAERKRNELAAKRAEEEGRPPETVERIRTSGKRREPAKPKKKGPILAVLSWPGPAGIKDGEHTTVLYSREGNSNLDSITEKQWRELPREPWPPALDARIVTPIGSYAFDPTDRDDIARVTDIVVQDCPTWPAMEVRSRLSRVPQGCTVTFEPAPSSARSV
jgi:hypothetical protein